MSLEQDDNYPPRFPPELWAGLPQAAKNRIRLDTSGQDMLYKIDACLQDEYAGAGKEVKISILKIRERIENLNFQ